MPEHVPEGIQQFRVATHEVVGFVDQHILLDQVKIPEVDELHELAHRSPVADVLLDPLEELYIILAGCRKRDRTKRFRHDRSQCRFDEVAIAGDGLVC